MSCTTMSPLVRAVLVFSLTASCVHSRRVDCRVTATDNGTTMDCSHRGLTSFCDVDLSDVTRLDLSGNRLSQWGTRCLSGLSSLRHLNLRHNALRALERQAMEGLQGLETLELSHNQLTAVSSAALASLPRLQRLLLDHNQLSHLGTLGWPPLTELRHLDLGYNQLQVLHNHTLPALPALTWLGLRANGLQRLEAGAMTGLHSLTHLDLALNGLQLTSAAYPPRVFAPLAQLQVLHLELNDDRPNGEYPDHVFSDLVSLTSLSIDTFNTVYFGPDFAALRNIHTLIFNESCRVHQLTNTSFEGFKNSTLASITFGYCPLQFIETCAFCDLPALARLRFQNAHYQTPLKILESLYGLQHQTMTEIQLDSIGNYIPLRYSVNSHSTRYLRNICVQNFTMTNCNIQRITGNAITVVNTPLFDCLENADLSFNPLIGDTSTLIKMIFSNGPLRSLQLQDSQTFSISESQCLIGQYLPCKEYLRDGGYNEDTYMLHLRTPVNMTYLNLSSLYAHLNPLPLNLTIHSANNLRILDLSYLGFANCRSTFYGLENLETFSLNGNYCYNMTDRMFDFMDSLKELRLSNFGFNPDFLVSRGWRLFQNLDQLQRLDLSRNELPYTDPDMLRAQRRLTQLDLSYNRLQHVPVTLRHHADLRRLDLSHNFLTTLTSSERAELDRLSSRHQFSLQLAGNPLECACFNLDMVQWLWHTSVWLDGEGRAGNYTCSTETGEISSTERVMAQWMSQWRRCVGVPLFGIALSALLLQLLALLLAFVLVRSWSQLCYAWKTLRRLRLPRRQHFPFDAYLVHSDAVDDVMLACVTLRRCLEERLGVRLLLREREEEPGSVRAENIVQHIDSSWKVVLLVTLAFSQDEWACGFTVQQAQRGITDSMPHRVIVVFLEDPARLPAMPSLQLLLRMVPERNVLHVYRDTPPQHAVWRSLADLITREQ